MESGVSHARFANISTDIAAAVTSATAATLREREKNRFRFSVRIQDGERTVANVEHERAAVSLQKIMGAISSL